MVYCVYSLESPHRGDSNESTQYTFMLKKIKKILIKPPDLALLINPHLLELVLSRTNFHGPKGVRAIEVRLYPEDHFIQMIFIDSVIIYKFYIIYGHQNRT